MVPSKSNTIKGDLTWLQFPRKVELWAIQYQKDAENIIIDTAEINKKTLHQLNYSFWIRSSMYWGRSKEDLCTLGL